jgi:hypothetical protein
MGGQEHSGFTCGGGKVGDSRCSGTGFFQDCVAALGPRSMNVSQICLHRRRIVRGNVSRRLNI